ncbi:hypothetical protein [Catellatospora methionotrophica]|uniref:hypothetical protein n=1 Tax=Catellatospora methionotrophica TaxID=121620 RepID=UPI00340CFEDC
MADSLIRTLCAAVAATAVAVSAMTAPATATVPESPALILHKWLVCPAGTNSTGVIAYSQPLVEPGDRYVVEVGGTFTPCKPPTGSHQVYGLGAYRGTEAYGRAVPFGDLGKQTYNVLADIRIYPDVQALCLIADETTRLSCVSIGWVTVDGVAHHVIDGPLPVDSPRVAMTARTIMWFPDSQPIGPGCTTCPDPDE